MRRFFGMLRGAHLACLVAIGAFACVGDQTPADGGTDAGPVTNPGDVSRAGDGSSPDQGSMPNGRPSPDGGSLDVTVDSDGTDDVDGVSGLVWQEPPTADVMTRDDATAYCENLDLAGATNWRLPTISELRTIVAGCPDTEAGGACNLVDEGGRASLPPYESCDGCAAGGGPGPDGCYWDELTGPCTVYWSSTTLSDAEFEGHALDFETASMNTLGWFGSKEFNIRCVRDD